MKNVVSFIQSQKLFWATATLPYFDAFRPDTNGTSEHIYNTISSPEAAFLLVSTKDADLWDNPYQVPVKKQLWLATLFHRKCYWNRKFPNSNKASCSRKNIKMSL